MKSAKGIEAGLVAICVAFALFSPSLAFGGEAKTKIAVLDLKAERGLDEGLVKLLNELMLTEFERAGKYEVIGGSDLESMLKLEEQKRILECTEIVCLSEIGGALGVDKLAFANIGKIGDLYLINLKIINVRESRVEKRVSYKVRGIEETLVNAIAAAVKDVTGGDPEAGSERPAGVSFPPTVVEEEKPSRVGFVPIMLWSAGGAGIIAGVVFGVMAKEHRDNANDPNFVGSQLEIEKGKSDQLIANIAYGVGAAGVVAGFLVWLLSGDDDDRTTVVPIVTPSSAGIGFVLEY